MTQPDRPYFLQGNFAPVADERTAHDLPVAGRIPPELDGTYLRNGPNPKSGVSRHWITGDGMLHGVRLAGGQARWYRNRYLETARLDSSASLPADCRVRLRGGGASNTHIIEHGGRLLSLVECSLPLQVDGELGTLGALDFDGRVDTPVAAHPKRCPRTGELHLFGYQHAAPHLTYYIAGADGAIVRRQEVEVGGPSMMHDFAITEHYALFFDTPLRMVDDWGGGAFPFQWSDTHQARIVAVPRGGGAARAFDVASGHLGHTVNAFEASGRIILDGVRYTRLDGPPLLYRWELALDSGRVTERPLDARPYEFPRIDERRTGSPHRYAYALELQLIDGAPTGSRLRRHDATTGESAAYALAASQLPGECVFVPAGEAEGEGWLLTIVYDSERDGSDLVILDAGDFQAPPVARIRLPQRVPFGFHGSWVPAGS